jgi:hypothetical protein
MGKLKRYDDDDNNNNNNNIDYLQLGFHPVAVNNLQLNSVTQYFIQVTQSW